MSNRMLCILGADGYTNPFTGYQERGRIGLTGTCIVHLTTPTHMATKCVWMCSWSDKTQSCLSTPTCSLVSMMVVWSGCSEGCTVVVLLLNQLLDDNHYDYIFDYSRTSHMESQWITSDKWSDCRLPSTHNAPLTALEYSSFKKCQYLKNNCLKFKYSQKNYNYMYIYTRKILFLFFSDKFYLKQSLIY